MAVVVVVVVLVVAAVESVHVRPHQLHDLADVVGDELQLAALLDLDLEDVGGAGSEGGDPVGGGGEMRVKRSLFEVSWWLWIVYK